MNIRGFYQEIPGDSQIFMAFTGRYQEISDIRGFYQEIPGDFKIFMAFTRRYQEILRYLCLLSLGYIDRYITN